MNEQRVSGPHIAGFAPIGGAMMYYEVHGTGEPILFIHGGGDSIARWGGSGGYIEQLSTTYMVVVADSRGQGRSTEGEGPITYGRVGYDAIRLLDHLGIQRAHFVGHSAGAVAILHILIDYPERVVTATLMGALYNVANYRPEAYQEMKRQLEAQLRGDEASPETSPASGPESTSRPRYLPPESRSCPLSVMRKFHSSWLTQPTLSLEQLEQIDRSVLVIKADHDQFMEPRVFDELHAHLKGSTLLFCAGATHAVPTECRERIVPAIQAHIARS